MTVKKISLIINAIIAFAIVLIAVLFFFLSHRNNELSAASSNRFYTILLVDELRKSSEELTRNVQMYAATGSAQAEDAYIKVLAIRSGQMPRPAGAYVAPGQKRVLLDLLKEYGITDEEFSLVEKANALSDDLVALEVEAMNAVKGIFKDSAGEYTIRAAPDRELAMSLVFSDSYFEEVRKIMAPMDEFQDMVYNRTAQSMQEAQAQQKAAEKIAVMAIVLIFLAGGYAFAGNTRNLRKIKASMEDIREADELTHVMFDATPLSINLIDKDLSFIDCNEETIKLFGITDKQKYLKNFFAFSPEYQPNGRLSKEFAAEHLTRALEEGYWRTEWTHQKPNGELIPCEVVLVRIKYKGDDALAGYAHDLRRIKAVTAKMNEAYEYTQILIDSTPLCCVLFDKNSNVLTCNQSAVELFKVSRKEDVINSFFDFSPEYQPDGILSREAAIDIIEKAHKNGYSSREWTHKSTDGELIPCAVTLVRVKYKDDYVVAGYADDLREIRAKEAEVYEANERTAIMFNAMPLCTSYWTREPKIIDCNEEVVRLFELVNKQEYINRFNDLSPEFQPDGRPSGETSAMLVLKAYEEGYCHFEWLMQKLNGEPIPVEIDLIRVEYGDDYIVIAYFRDLRDIKAKEAEARDAVERTQIMFDSMPLGVNYWNKNFENIDSNQEAVKLFGVSSKKEYNDRFFELSPEYQPNGRLSNELAVEYVNKTFEEGYHRFEWLHRKLNGDLLPAEITLVRVKHKGEYFVAGYTRDLREIKAAEAKMREADEHTRIMLDATPLSCILIDRNYRFIDCNKETLKLFGVSNKQDYLSRFYDFSPQFQPDGQNSQDKAFGFFTKVFDEGYASFEWLHINAAGEFVPVEVILVRVKYKDDYILAGYTRDMRAVKAQEALKRKMEKQKAEAEAVSRAKSDFLARVSHEIRTPMNAILGITEIQLQNETLPQGVEEALGKIYNSGYLLLGIINEILDLSKIEAGRLELMPIQYDLASLIHDTVQLNLARYDSKPIDFRLEVDENIPSMLFGDELRIKQILNNVLSNAFKYTDIGEVSLSITVEPENSGLKSKEEKPGLTIVFRISDTGQGMTEDQLAKLFTEYSRFNMEANRTTEGAGLGMSIARNLVQMMNGEILVESEPGKGSVFTVRLPQGIAKGGNVLGKASVENLQRFRMDKTSRMKKTPQIVREYMPYGRVLVVDDVETNLYVIRGLLAPYGVSLETVISGFEAIDKIESGSHYDIIFMDHFMPKMDGIEAVKIIRTMGYKHPIIALTANALAGQAEMFLANGFDDYLSKPIDIRQLNALLNKLVRDKYPPEVVETARRIKNNMKKSSRDDDLQQPSNDIRMAFIRDAEKAAAVMKTINGYGYRRDADVQTYIIYVHAMKSALANVGEAELSAFALKLEDGGRKGNTALLLEETPAFLDELWTVIEKTRLKEDDGNTGNAVLTDEDDAYLREKLAAIQAACTAYDRKAAKDALDELRRKTWTPAARKLLDTIDEHLLHSDFEEAMNAAQEYITRKPE